MSQSSMAEKAFPQARFIETHLSVVALTDEFAYKLKKAVVLPFVDQKSLEARFRLCRLELELNRRFSGAELYLAVVGFRADGSFEDTEVQKPEFVEFGVKMRLFSQEDQGDNALKNGRLNGSHFEKFGRELAASHAGLPQSNVPSTEHRDQMDNIRYLEDVDEADQAKVKLLGLHLEGQGAKLAGIITRRREQGFVRDCHGDLHLSNTVLCNDRLVAFDCLEFNEELRSKDVVCDLAFLTMDLDSRGRQDLAMSLLSSYMEWSGDWDGMELYNYYCVYRTLIRAKVAAISKDFARMRMHIDLAMHYVQRKSAFAVIMSGVSGSGKSFVAHNFVEPLCALRIRSDVIRKQLFNMSPLEKSASHKSDIYTPEATARVYQRVRDIVGLCLREKISVIVDATNTKKSVRDNYRSLCAQHDCSFFLVACSAKKEVLLKRVEERKLVGNDPSEASQQVLEGQLERTEPILPEEGALLIDTSAGLTKAETDAFAAQLLDSL